MIHFDVLNIIFKEVQASSVYPPQIGQFHITEKEEFIMLTNSEKNLFENSSLIFNVTTKQES